jgi:hypothetical protein
MDGIILKAIRVKKTHVEFQFKTTGILQKYFTTDTMFIDYQEDMSEVPESILVIPFVASFLPLMWLTNTVMWVTELDRTFYDSVSKIKDAYQRLYYHYDLKGNLVAARLVENAFEVERPTMLLYSGGLDASASYIRIKETNPLLFNIQGWYKHREDTDVFADADIRDIGAFAKTENLDFTFAKSNFAVVVNDAVFNKNVKKKLTDSWWHGFQHSMSFISISIPLAYLKKIRTINIASSVPMGEYCMCASHVTTDSEFKFATVGGCIHDGSELSRQDKVHIVINYQKSLNRPYFMRVCSFNDHNCCECEKCFRTILGIVAEGRNIKDFGFNIDGSLKQHWINVLDKKAGLMGFASEKVLHWPYIKQRMKENYDIIEDKDFVDWFFNFDFDKAKRDGVMKYYRQNFFSIVKRKLHL